MDPELGDRKFYLEVVEPFKKKYGAYVGAIKPDMPDAEVNRIYDEAYLTLINTKYVIQKLRREYLAKRFVEE